MTYKLGKNCIIRLTDIASIPLDARNADYCEYLAWAAAGGAAQPMDVPTIIQYKATAATKIKTDASQIVGDTILQLGTEYQQANTDAAAYKAASYTGTVPSSVASWAAAKIPAQTAQWACDDILAAAANWQGAQQQIRAQRLKYQELVKNATTQADVDAAAVSWASFKTTIRTSLGI